VYPIFTSASTVIHIVAKRPRTFLAVGLLATASSYAYSVAKKPTPPAQIERTISKTDRKTALKTYTFVAETPPSDVINRKTAEKYRAGQ
jgi:hypothetical protein